LPGDAEESDDIYKIKDIEPYVYNIESFLQDSELENLVYPEYQYRPEYPPSLIFLPSKGVLFRLIRAAYLGS